MVRRLIHYSDAHLTHVYDTTYTFERDDKPDGLWVSVEGKDDWPSWCRSEDFRLRRLTHPTEIILAADANILRISGASALRKFHAAYKKRSAVGEPEYCRDRAIDWGVVADQYDGIIIAPYVWSLRLDGNVRWYYSWDCASGCIWRSRAVKALRPLPETGLPKISDVCI